MKAKHFTLVLLGIVLTHVLPAQGRLVLNGGIITISNGAHLVVDNSSANAITRNSGHIVSEGQNNRVKWNIGTTVGNYTVPFGYNGSFIPVSFSKNSGAGTGTFVFSTYHTSWKNSDHLPTGIPNMTGSMPDHSPWAIDRFWQVSAEGYTAKPSLSNLTLSYVDAEHQAAGNNIIEAYLSAQQYHETEVGWDEVQPGGTTNISANTVTVATVPSSAFFKWWTLTDQLYPLPVQLLQFTANASGKTVVLQWNVSGEKPGTQYRLQRRKEGGYFENIATIDGTPATGEKVYAYKDAMPYDGRWFYRIVIREDGGGLLYSPERVVSLKGDEEMAIYPNPVVGRSMTVHLSTALQGTGLLVLYNQAGYRVATYSINARQAKVPIDLPTGLPAGTYVCQWQTAKGTAQRTVVVY